MQKRGIVRMFCLQCGKDSPQSRLRGLSGGFDFSTPKNYELLQYSDTLAGD